MKSITVTLEDGVATFVYDDDLAELVRAGILAVARASYVEPVGDGSWTADLSPVGGPDLGPFYLRSDALAAEREWLQAWLDQGGVRGFEPRTPAEGA